MIPKSRPVPCAAVGNTSIPPPPDGDEKIVAISKLFSFNSVTRSVDDNPPSERNICGVISGVLIVVGRWWDIEG